MYFVTVGLTQPFDRLIRLVDEAVGEGRIDPNEVVAQIGAGRYVPRYISRYQRFIEPRACRRLYEASKAVVSHGGMGTIMDALAVEKPLIAVPRRPDLGECVDDHQVRTALVFTELGHILTAQTLDELEVSLEKTEVFRPRPRRPRLDPLCERLASFVSVCEAGHRARLPSPRRALV